MTTIREERSSDIDGIRRVNETAFGQKGEADLVDLLRARGKLRVSLVFESEGRIVGHIAFTRVRLEPERAGLTLAGLGPMAVIPGAQRRGIGKTLVTAGLDACRRIGVHAVVVLGHRDYYPLFGFKRASAYRIRCVYEAPDEAFMAMELRPGALGTSGGTVFYEEEFDAF